MIISNMVALGKPKIKMLPLDSWMKSRKVIQADIDHLIPWTGVTFNRPGIYLVGDDCWFEGPYGNFKASKRQFLYDLRAKMHRPLRDVEFSLLKELKKHLPLSAVQLQLLYQEHEFRHLRSIHFDTAIRFRNFKKKIKQKRLENNESV